MKILAAVVVAAAFAPAAYAQVYYEQPRVVDRGDLLTRGELRECMARDSRLAERRARLDGMQAEVDRESDMIARDGAQLADELRRLDSGDASAVAAYNARSAAHNQRVRDHNRRVADSNERAARINAANANMDLDCGRPYRPRDRDIILMERGSLR